MSVDEGDADAADSLFKASRKLDTVLFANEIIERGRIPLALFLEDCLRSVDPEFMTTIVERYIQAGKHAEKSKRLYFGEQTMYDDKGLKRSSLERFDMPTLLHVFAFAIGTKHEKSITEPWHPKIGERFNVEATALNKIKVLKDWRNAVAHEQERLKEDVILPHIAEVTSSASEHIESLLNRMGIGPNKTDERAVLLTLLNDYKYVFAQYVFGSMRRRSEVFSSKTHSAVAHYLRFLRKLEWRLRLKPILIRVSATVVFISIVAATVAALVYDKLKPHQHDIRLSKRENVFVVLAESIDRMDTRVVAQIIGNAVKPRDTVRLRVYIDSSSAYIDRTIINEIDSIHACIRSMSGLSMPMVNYTKLTAAFIYASDQMLALDTADNQAHMYIVGHVPPDPSAEEYERLKRIGWHPGRDPLLTHKWQQRRFGRPRWVFTGMPSDRDRSFFRTIMHSKDSTLLPVEYSL